MGRPLIDLSGKTFGKYTVLHRNGSIDGVPLWECQCDCGTVKTVRGNNLRNGLSKSCGCERIARTIAATKKRRFVNKTPIDLTGMSFWRWTVIEPVGDHFIPNRKWRCRCQCGIEKEVYGNNLKSGRTKSCGCLRVDTLKNAHTVHGFVGHPIYNSWCGMIQRCENPNNNKFHHYGGRGITVCKRWHKFPNFLLDMFPTWEAGLSLDRIDVNGNYEPSNCRWATDQVQHANRRPRSVSRLEPPD